MMPAQVISAALMILRAIRALTVRRVAASVRNSAPTPFPFFFLVIFLAASTVDATPITFTGPPVLNSSGISGASFVLPEIGFRTGPLDDGFFVKDKLGAAGTALGLDFRLNAPPPGSSVPEDAQMFYVATRPFSVTETVKATTSVGAISIVWRGAGALASDPGIFIYTFQTDVIGVDGSTVVTREPRLPEMTDPSKRIPIPVVSPDPIFVPPATAEPLNAPDKLSNEFELQPGNYNLRGTGLIGTSGHTGLEVVRFKFPFAGQFGHDIRAVPDPSSLTLLVSAILGVLVYSWSRSSSG
jgi:hypothetical protein